MTAQVWEKSTGLSLTHVFGGDADLKAVPPSNDKWAESLLGKRAHFINCHGADTSSQFYGQPASHAPEYPVSLDAAYIDGKITEGTVVAAECCYGAQLYDPALLNGQKGICSTYLLNKAYGFFGSTTIAYGPEDSNAQADLLCQFFLNSVLRGASLGRAALEARHKFVQSASPPDPFDTKTLAQFNLYGDPSLTPVKVPTPTIVPIVHALKDITGPEGRGERADRRRALFRIGTHLTETEPRPHPVPRKPSKSIRGVLEGRAREMGIEAAAVLTFRIIYPQPPAPTIAKTLVAREITPTNFHVVFGKAPRKDVKGAKPVPNVVAMVAKEVAGEVVSVIRTHSR